MKKFIALICACVASFAIAATATVGGKTWTYETSDDYGYGYDGVTITGGPDSGALVIPKTIKGQPVVAIGESAFEGCTKITSLTIPNTVREILYSAFEGCSGIKTLVMPMCSINGNDGFDAPFFGCVNIQKVEFVDTLEGNGWEVFRAFNRSGVRPTEVTLSAVAAANAPLSTEGGWSCELFDRVKILNADFSRRDGEGSIELPHLETLNLTFDTKDDEGEEGGDVESIWITIKNCPNLKAINGLDACRAPLSLTLENLNALKALKIPQNIDYLVCNRNAALSSITVVDNGSNNTNDEYEDVGLSFAFCPALKKLDLSAWENVYLGGNGGFGDAFAGCIGLTEVVLPEDLDFISDFRGCTALKKIVIPDGVSEIGYNAFRGCTALTEVVIPASVHTIYGNAFRGCTALKKIKFAGEPPLISGENVFPETAIGEYYVSYSDDWKRAMGDSGSKWNGMTMTTDGKVALKLEAYPEDAGKVTGAGEYKDGTKVTLKATANKGYVFTGWHTWDEDYGMYIPLGDDYDEEGNWIPPAVDNRALSYPYTVTTWDTTLYAFFMSEEEIEELNDPIRIACDIYSEDGEYLAWIDLVTDEAYEDDDLQGITIDPAQEICAAIDVMSWSLPTVKVAGLPTGLKFDAKTSMITGAPTNPGRYTVTVTASATFEEEVVGRFIIWVNNYNSPELDILDNHGGDDGVIDNLVWGGFVPGMPCVYSLDEAEGCKVSGLPPGMKWDAKTCTITGTPTKPGDYTVTFTKGTEKETVVITVQPFPVLKLGYMNEEWGIFEDEEDGAYLGKLSGAGEYAVGKTVTLTATPNKGYFFAGWYDGVGELGSHEYDEYGNRILPTVDYRTPSYPYVMSDRLSESGYDRAIYARFVTEEYLRGYEEMYINLYNRSSGLEYEAGEPIDPIEVEVYYPTLPKVTVTGLPAGLKFDAKNFTITGTPKNPGDYTLTVTAQDTVLGRIKTQPFDLYVRHFNAHGIHDGGRADLDVEALFDEGIPLSGVFDGKLRYVDIKSLMLPAGLTYDKKTNTIKGNGKIKCGSYTATLTDINGDVTTFTINVDADPAFELVTDLYLLHEDSPTIGFVQGEASDIDILELYAISDDEDDYRYVSVDVIGLPAGLKFKFENDPRTQWNSEYYGYYGRTYCEVEIFGKTSAAAGRYPVEIFITDKRTGRVDKAETDVYVYPALTAGTVDGTWTSGGFVEESIPIDYCSFYDLNPYNKNGSIALELLCQMKGTNRTCTYDAIFTDSNGKAFVKTQTMKFDEVVAWSDGDGIVYDYYFEGQDNDDGWIAADLLIKVYDEEIEMESIASMDFFYHGKVNVSPKLNTYTEIRGISAEREASFEVEEEGSYSLNHVSNFRQSGFVQGEKNVIEVGEVNPSPGTKLANIKVAATGLPAGINVVTERDDDDDVLEIYLQGTTKVDPGHYDVVITVTDSATGFAQDLAYTYVVLPKPPEEWYGTYTATRYDFPIGYITPWGDYRQIENGNASAILIITVDEGTKKAQLISDCTYGSGWSYNGNPPLDRVCIFMSEDDNKIGYCYSFWHETSAGDEAYGDLIFWVDMDENGNPDFDSDVITEMCCGLYVNESGLCIWEDDEEYAAPF